MKNTSCLWFSYGFTMVVVIPWLGLCCAVLCCASQTAKILNYFAGEVETRIERVSDDIVVYFQNSDGKIKESEQQMSSSID